MSQSKVKILLVKYGQDPSHRNIAKHLGCSASTICNMLKYGTWPRNKAKLQDSLVALLQSTGAKPKEIDAALSQIQPKPAQQKQELNMIRKQVLNPDARRKFAIPREIFSDNLNDPDDVFFSRETRYVRECLYQVAKHGGMLALIGESGSGKSTLRRDLISRLQREESRVIVIEPYVLGLRKDDKQKGLESTHICQSIISTLSPSAQTSVSSEKLFALTHQILRDSSRSGFTHLLIIEEAHCLHPVSIKILKRFFELEDGLQRLLSIILIGQSELKEVLAENKAEVREVVQRMELVQLYPLDDFAGYVRHRCARAGVEMDNVFAPNALDALPARLSGPTSSNGAHSVSMVYPLLVGNVLTRAINIAAELKLPKVTAECIQTA